MQDDNTRHKDPPASKDQAAARRLREFETVAERAIREAMEQGEFRNRGGKGRWIGLEGYRFEDPGTRIANRLLKNAGFSPPFIEEGKSLDNDREKICAELRREWSAGWALRRQRAEERFRNDARALNRRILTYNLKVQPRFHKSAIDVERELDALRG